MEQQSFAISVGETQVHNSCLVLCTWWCVRRTHVSDTLNLVPRTMYLDQVSSAQVHCIETTSCNFCFQEELVPEYNVTTTFKAFVGASSSQHNWGIN